MQYLCGKTKFCGIHTQLRRHQNKVRLVDVPPSSLNIPQLYPKTITSPRGTWCRCLEIGSFSKLGSKKTWATMGIPFKISHIKMINHPYWMISPPISSLPVHPIYTAF